MSSESSRSSGSLGSLNESTTSVDLNVNDAGFVNDFTQATRILLEMSAASQQRLKSSLEECTLTMGDMRTRKIIYSAIESFIQSHPSPVIRLVSNFHAEKSLLIDLGSCGVFTSKLLKCALCRE